jgi:hypothetical protein
MYSRFHNPNSSENLAVGCNLARLKSHGPLIDQFVFFTLRNSLLDFGLKIKLLAPEIPAPLRASPAPFNPVVYLSRCAEKENKVAPMQLQMKSTK